MEKLTAADASFLYSETGRCHNHVGSVQILELPENTTTRDFIKSLKTFIGNRAHLVSYMTRKLSFVPGSVDHPVWIQDGQFDIDNHIIEIPVAAPGDRAALEQTVASLHSQKMPLDRPLWALYVITDLADGRIAYYNQAHHAAIDGASGNAAIEVLMDDTSDHPDIEPLELPSAESESPLSLLEGAFENFLRFQLDSGSRWMGMMDTSRRLMQRAIDPSRNFGALAKQAPKTRFNGQITANRTWMTAELPLAEMKKIGKTIGATLNDVFLTVCSTALSNYLQRHGELPEDSLIAGCPVSLRQPGDTKPGNQVTMMNVELATNLDDPLEKLMAIGASAKVAKEMVADLSGAFESNMALPGLPMLATANLNTFESMGLANWLRTPINVVISNVPGPRNTLYSNGARMMTHYPVSIPAHGLGLNITVQSYEDQMYVGVTACAKALPDPDVLRADFLDAYQQLKTRVLPDNVSELRSREPMAAPTKQTETSQETASKVA